MRKIFKKSLACVLALVLCITAIAGCLAVSADDTYAGSDGSKFGVSFYTAQNKEVKTACYGQNFRAQLFTANIAAGLTVGATIALPAGLEITSVTTGGAAGGPVSNWNYNEETGIFSMIAQTGNAGNYLVAIYFTVTEAATAATYTNITADIETALTSSGDLYYDNVITASALTIAADHNYKSETTDATCDTAGSTVYTCLYCDDTYTETIDALGHTEVTDAAVAPTCTETGLTEGSHCSVCDAVLVAQETVDALGHSYDNGVVTTEPKCEEAGVKTFTCATCGDTYTEAVDATGHTAVTDEAVAPTCTKTGLTEGSHCSVCDAVLVAQEVVEATGHGASQYTDNGDGTHDATCAVCSETVVDNEAHTYTEGTCVCGVVEATTGPALDTNLVFRTVSLACGDKSFELNFRVRGTVLDLYDNVKLVITPQKYDSVTGNLVENVTPIVIEESQLDTVVAGSMFGYTYKDAWMYELGLNIDYKLEGYNAAGELVAYSETFSNSPAEMLKSLHSSAVTVGNTEYATMITDILIVADEAVKSWALSMPEGAYVKTAPSILEGYDTSDRTTSNGTPNTVNEFTGSYEGVSQDRTATHRVIQSVTLEKYPYLSIRIKDSAQALDMSKLSFNISYSRMDSNGNTVDYNQTFTTANSSYITYSSGYITFLFEEIGIQNNDKTITITVTYGEEDFFTYVYSVETYLSTQLSNPSVGALYDALIKLGVSFKAYTTK